MFKIFQEAKTIHWLINQKNLIDFNPPYQRPSGLWNKEQKQLLIDSILNGFDIPKFYFQFMPPVEDGKPQYNYAVIDGKQRIETILSFVEEEFPLSSKFTFWEQDLQVSEKEITGKYYGEIEYTVPAVIARFLQYEINIVFMDTINPDPINEMFVRLNSGISANTAEKRNAIGGTLSLKISELCSKSLFFVRKIKISNNRFQHNDLAIKMLMLELGEKDLTKKSVDSFVKKNKDFDNICRNGMQRLERKLSILADSFPDKCVLLSKNIIITLYAALDHLEQPHLYTFLNNFEEQRMQSSKFEDSDAANQDLIEFTRLLQQGADKKSSIERRTSIMENYYNKYMISLST